MILLKLHRKYFERRVSEDTLLQKCIICVFAIILLSMTSCVEEIDFETENFESILVVNATITNENKRQEIQLSRTFEFGEDENPEENAQVSVVGNGTTYEFQEIMPGTYQSMIAFSAESAIDYKLMITTSNGSEYTSNQKQLTTVSQIDNLYSERIINDDGVDGVGIFVDSFDPTNTANYYRYTFEETYKIVAPFWREEDLFFISDNVPADPLLDYEFIPCQVGFKIRPENQKVCFTSESSTGLNIISTSQINTSSVDAHLVTFLANDNFKISHRYSLLVHQFVISEEAFSYLEIMKSFTSQGSLFSQVQTGFVPGNMVSTLNPNEKVIGMFDVVSVTNQRLYFNYKDFYPNTALPPFIIKCSLRAPSPFIKSDGTCGPLINIVRERFSVYLRDYDGNPPINNGPDPVGPYYTIPQACGDCTALGDSEPPSFWED